MLRSRRLALAPLLVAIAAATLTGCSTPATAFHFVGTTPAPSRAFPNEVQGFAGTYTVEADDLADVADLRWTITTGPWFDPAAETILTTDGVGRVTAELTAPTDHTKRSYRICLSSIAQPLLETCEHLAVGGTDLWSGWWRTELLPVSFVATQQDRDLALTFQAPRVPPAPTSGPLRSPFLYVATIDGTEVTFEWISSSEILSYDAFTAYPQPVRFVPLVP